MSELIQELQREYGYSDYDIAKVKYVLASLFSEFSKLFLFGLSFGILGYFYPFLFSIILLLFLRINIGGLHCKHYISCLFLTSIILYASIMFLPNLVLLSTTSIIFFSIICMVINYYIGPVASPFRPSPDSVLIKSCRNIGFFIIFTFILFVSIFQNNSFLASYIQVGFWTIVLHTIQLIIAKLLRRGGIY
ncbi:MAG: accessory gene regulator B family protein [Eubacterium sp.]|nr:accessory gene regulator B family protein [Eubacterium sp.]